MKDIILKNRFSLLATVLSAYIIVVVMEGAVTGREPDWLRFDNSLFTLDLRQLDELDGLDIEVF